jgi:hypothetical protein
LQAVCHQRLFENELRFLRTSHNAFERQRIKQEKEQIEPDAQFWKTWTESMAHYSGIERSWGFGQSKLSEEILRNTYRQTWDNRDLWGSDRPANAGEFGAKYRLPLGIGSCVAEAVGFALSILKEFVGEREIEYSFSEL